MKWFFRLVLLGALIGAVLSTLIGQRTIGWYIQTPVETGINCRPSAEWAMQRLQWAQLIGLAVGAVIGALLALAMRPRKTVEPNQEFPPPPQQGNTPQDPRF